MMARHIARVWHGRVPTAKARAYRQFHHARAIPEYRCVGGNLNVYGLERADGAVTHFITLTLARRECHHRIRRR